jgi:hypothetical protein
MSNESYSNKVTQETYSNANVSHIKEQCNRCNKEKESDELKEFTINMPDDIARLHLCESCERGLFRYINGEKLVNEQ